MGWVISGMGDFGSCSIFGSVWLRVGLFRVFGLKSVGLISDVSSDMGLGFSVRVSGLESVLPGLRSARLIKWVRFRLRFSKQKCTYLTRLVK